jgi:peroxiredoxin
MQQPFRGVCQESPVLQQSKSFSYAILVQCLALLLFAQSSLVGCVDRHGLGPGDKPPEFSLPSTEGSQVSLSDVKGKVVLVNFWASWCVPCLKELPALERLRLQLGSKDFEVLAIGIDDDMKSLRQAAQRAQVTFPILLDHTGEAKRLYKVQGVPESFILDKEGTLQLLDDPASGPVVKIVGPRDWDTGTFLNQIKELAAR